VAEAALQSLEHVRCFVNAVEKKTVAMIKTKSYQTIREFISDDILKVKIHSFASLSAVLEPFLVQYQTDSPMLPFLSDDLGNLLRTLLRRVMDSDAVSKLTTSQLMDIHSKIENVQKINIGFEAEKELRELVRVKKVTELQAFGDR
jgi:glycyl-tRNA synthetase beta subunit